jgi:hypothetical protein
MTLSFWRGRHGGAILLIVLTSLAFAILDTTTKHATRLAPVLMLLWFRYAFQAVVTFAMRFPSQRAGLFATPNPRFQLLRGVLLLTTSACAFFGLQHLPVGEFTSIIMLSPMVATAMAAAVLKDHVAPVRWALMALGLLGVLLVVRPGGQVFGWALLFPMLLVVAYAWFNVLTSRLNGTVFRSSPRKPATEAAQAGGGPAAKRRHPGRAHRFELRLVCHLDDKDAVTPAPHPPGGRQAPPDPAVPRPVEWPTTHGWTTGSTGCSSWARRGPTPSSWKPPKKCRAA